VVAVRQNLASCHFPTGEVAAIGEEVTRVKLGDRIIGTFHPRWFGGPLSADYLTDRLGANFDGMLAEYAVFNEEAVVVLPSHLSFEEAATLPCAAVTAWVALTGHRRVTAGDTVLTQGSGGVSIFALQFARVLGARVIATTSTAEKAERLKALGASEVINYAETPDWDEKARGRRRPRRSGRTTHGDERDPAARRCARSGRQAICRARARPWYRAGTGRFAARA
jgi:NADPH:quinone reductase-like Zn-dependent oxidoreductase